MQKRHLDTGIFEHEFAQKDHWVLCPDCQKVGILHRRACGHYTFCCRGCGKLLDEHHHNQHHRLISYSHQQFRYYVFSGRFRCYHCGGRWLKSKHYLPNIGHIPHTFYAICPLCHQQSTHHKVNEYHSVYADYTPHLGINHFGLELALRTSTRFGTLYVYNPAHLNVLKAFIEADLRERAQKAGNGSYFSRLPDWIKSAKNRKELLRAITKLEQLVSPYQSI
ncbi:MAG: hypothetical protein Q4C68_05300 [Moraxella sp.]|nr:hypothetical protein [Moraxella sp.]